MNHGNVVYVKDNDNRLVSYNTNQMIIRPGERVQIAGISKIESVKLVSRFTISSNTIIAFRASQIPGDWNKPDETPSWPAFWLAPFSDTWGVTAGEIDIYESVNGSNVGVTTTQHTFTNCKMDGSITGKSTLKSDNCNAGYGITQPSVGCGVIHTDINSARSGTFACAWRVNNDKLTGSIDFFWWPYNDTYVGVWEQFPKVSDWENAKYASFKIDPYVCSANHFKDFNLVINTNFCGDWSGRVFSGEQSACAAAISKIDTTKQQWRFDAIRVYKIL
jgi:hypothetical protein